MDTEHHTTHKTNLSSTENVLNPNHFFGLCCRMMYWSVIGDHSHLEESAMDGSLRRVILEKNLRRPTGQYVCFYKNTCIYTYIHTHSV